MDKSIEKSPEMLAKEAKVKGLKTRLKKRKAKLKTLKTRLKNTKTEIENVQREVQSMMFSKMSKMESLRVAISELALNMNNSRAFNKADKQLLDKMTKQFLGKDIFGEEFERIREAQRKAEKGDFDFDDNFRAKMKDAFQEFRVEPEEKEQRNIRKVFIKLSRKFHPDLADNDKQAGEYHSIMQRINEAYQSNDIHTLLEMEDLYFVEEFDFTMASVTIETLQDEIERLQRDVDFINGQVDRTRVEVKQVRQSNMGAVLAEMKADNGRVGVIEAMEIEYNQTIKHLEQIKAGFEDSIERSAISPILMKMMNPRAAIFESDIQDNRSSQEDINEIGDLFGMMEEDDYTVNKNPKFPLGSVVKVKENMMHPFDKKVSMKGWQGWVNDTFIDERGVSMYTVLFDSQSMRLMSKKLIEQTIDDGVSFQDFDFSEDQLQVGEAQISKKTVVETYRRLRIETEWGMLLYDKKELKLIKSILLSDITKSDEINWENYLRECMPFRAKSKGKFKLKENRKVIVKDVYNLNSNVGFTVVVQEEDGRKGIYEYPLHDLLPNDKHLKMVAELHDIWFSEYSE